ncbi:hypothetical protein DB346_00490 [Verrucomicrobia bacterium LW23]|nr:hypothetical protein DB346_00490 [Verrucomicrobia bacterium LW23]
MRSVPARASIRPRLSDALFMSFGAISISLRFVFFMLFEHLCEDGCLALSTFELESHDRISPPPSVQSVLSVVNFQFTGELLTTENTDYAEREWSPG